MNGSPSVRVALFIRESGSDPRADGSMSPEYTGFMV